MYIKCFPLLNTAVEWFFLMQMTNVSKCCIASALSTLKCIIFVIISLQYLQASWLLFKYSNNLRKYDICCCYKVYIIISYWKLCWHKYTWLDQHEILVVLFDWTSIIYNKIMLIFLTIYDKLAPTIWLNTLNTGVYFWTIEKM